MDAQVKQTLHHYIGGQKVQGKSGRFSPIYNPAIGEVTSQAPLASVDEVKDAIAIAQEAFLSSTTKGVLPVVQVDDIKIGKGKVGKVVTHLNELLKKQAIQYRKNFK